VPDISQSEGINGLKFGIERLDEAFDLNKEVDDGFVFYVAHCLEFIV